MFVVSLIKENVLSVASVGGPLFQYSFVVNAMLRTEALPEHGSDCKPVSASGALRPRVQLLALITALPELHCNYFARHGCTLGRLR